ncbi:MAG: hypothetical protein EBZ76_10845 [Synechococcaceae bacterium WB9_2_170]|nr:hypothetical protein [Synechococcaceae bacterium WB9_2_170]
MKTLVHSLANTLLLGFDDPGGAPLKAPAPHVYTKAIASSGDLIASLSGVAELTRALGFTVAPETLYAPGGRSATYHADHQEASVSIAVECNPTTQTVALAVSGLDGDETYHHFLETAQTLFGDG